MRGWGVRKGTKHGWRKKMVGDETSAATGASRRRHAVGRALVLGAASRPRPAAHAPHCTAPTYERCLAGIGYGQRRCLADFGKQNGTEKQVGKGKKGDRGGETG